MSTGRILYVQYTNPAVLPPLQHSSQILADEGGNVQFIGTAVRGTEELTLPEHENISVSRLPVRPSGWRQKTHYLRYAAQVFYRALRWSPDWAYVSDPIGAPIGLLLWMLTGTQVVYHEHDSPSDPSSGSLFMQLVYRARGLLARRAEICILPNDKRLEFFKETTGRQAETLCVWNTPTREEVVSYDRRADPDPFYLHYHGSLVPERLPVSVIEALSRLPSRVQLRVAGYETSGAKGYTGTLRCRAREFGVENRLEIRESIPRRNELLEWASRSHVGLSFMPCDSEDINIKWMTGASNKPFDYMAAGIPMLVSDLADWRSMFVEPGYARACEPESPAGIANAVNWYLNQPAKRKSMAEKGRRRIESEWNYQSEFGPVKNAMEGKVQ